MGREIRFTLYEKPLAQKRHRRNGNRTYDPSATAKKYVGFMIKQYTENYASLNEHLLCGPIEVTMNFYMPMPRTKAARKKKGRYHTSKPDIDNLFKFYSDVMTGIIYADDAYICKINVTKYNSDTTRTEVIVKEILQEPIPNIELKH